MLESNASICVEETEGVVIDSGGDFAGIKDAFCGEVP